MLPDSEVESSLGLLSCDGPGAGEAPLDLDDGDDEGPADGVMTGRLAAVSLGLLKANIAWPSLEELFLDYCVYYCFDNIINNNKQ